MTMCCACVVQKLMICVCAENKQDRSSNKDSERTNLSQVKMLQKLNARIQLLEKQLADGAGKKKVRFV